MLLVADHNRDSGGAVPKDWPIRSLKEIVSTPITDGPHLTPAFVRDGVPFLSVNNLVDNKLDLSSLRYVSREDHEEFSKKCRPRRGDILFGKAASVGQVALIDTDVELNIWSPLALIRCGPTAMPRFIAFALQTYETCRQIAVLTNASSQGNIGMSDIGRIEVPVPDCAEQAAIASALSDMDALLEGLTRLIDKKRDLKKAAMQQLLTGQTRLPGFGGQWTTKPLDAIVSTPITDGPHLTPKFLSDGIPFLSVNNIVNNRLDLSTLRFVSRSDHEEFSRKCRPRRGDILFGKAASVGQVALLETDLELNIWSPLALIRVGNQVAARFVHYALQTRSVRRQIDLLTNASSQGNIGMSDIGRIEIPVPELPEQVSIAAALSDMDAELAALEARRDKTRLLKQGMMRELLTGRTRLV